MLNIPTEAELPLDELDPSLRPLVREYTAYANFLAGVGVPHVASTVLAETRYQEILAELSTLIAAVSDLADSGTTKTPEAIATGIEYRSVSRGLEQLRDVVNQIRTAQARQALTAPPVDLSKIRNGHRRP